MIPQLARTLGPKFNQFPCYVQPKLNGVRMLYQSGVCQSRDEKVWHPDKLRHITDQLRTLDELNGLILDGELYVHGWRLQTINGAVAVNSSVLRSDTRDVQYYVFDVIDPQRPGASFSERFLPVHQILQRRGLSHVIQCTTVSVPDRVMLETHFRSFVQTGYEGIMVRPNGPYILGRTGHDTEQRSRMLWKYKSWQDDEFDVVGTTRGEGKASIGIGALTCCTSNGRTFNVGTGFSDEERIYFSDNRPTLVKVRYLELSADGIPICPSFLCVM